MNQEVIQDFLNLPGIAGVALMDRRSRPYFCGVDQTLNFQQKEALAQGILQVVETIPDGFESFKFQFSGHQVHIYKLEHGIILLVLTSNNLDYSDYLKTIKSLKAALREDITNAIATFRLIAGNVTLSGLNYRQQNSPNLSGQKTPNAIPTVSQRSGPPGGSPPIAKPSPTPGPPASSTQPQARPTQVSPAVPSSGATPPRSPQVPPVGSPNGASAGPTLTDAIAALNQLSQFTAQYLGTHVIANYWKSTRPPEEWLAQFEIDRMAQFVIARNPTPQSQRSLSSAEQQWLKAWVAAFIKRCALVIRDFPTLIQQKALTPAQKALLLG